MRRPRKEKPRRPGYGLREYRVEVEGHPDIAVRANSMCSAIEKAAKQGFKVLDIHQL